MVSSRRLASVLVVFGQLPGSKQNAFERAMGRAPGTEIAIKIHK